MKVEEELLAFDSEDLVNGLGGALGLFLGWSLLHILNQCFQFLSRQIFGLKLSFPTETEIEVETINAKLEKI